MVNSPESAKVSTFCILFLSWLERNVKVSSKNIACFLTPEAWIANFSLKLDIFEAKTHAFCTRNSTCMIKILKDL